ncbi:hypothetical protein JW962_00870 [Candidatus Dojkabacteria bacterium]|nr:hypothetical protein [Candidatus Dojkabacteria bacterium]
MKKSILRITLGISILLIGAMLLAENLFPGFSFFDMAIFWPIFVIIPGIFFWSGFLSNRKDWGLVIPGTILIILGLGFFVNMIVSRYLGYGQIWSITSFMYTGSVSAAFFIAWYFADSKDKDGLLIPACILLAVSGSTFFNTALVGVRNFINSVMKILLPLSIIGVGIWLLSGRRKRE